MLKCENLLQNCHLNHSFKKWFLHSLLWRIAAAYITPRQFRRYQGNWWPLDSRCKFDVFSNRSFAESNHFLTQLYEKHQAVTADCIFFFRNQLISLLSSVCVGVHTWLWYTRRFPPGFARAATASSPHLSVYTFNLNFFQRYLLIAISRIFIDSLFFQHFFDLLIQLIWFNNKCAKYSILMEKYGYFFYPRHPPLHDGHFDTKIAN